MGTTALVGSVGSAGGISTQPYSTMIRILLFSLLISLALGLPQLSLSSGGASLHQAAALDHRHAWSSEHHQVKRSPEEAGAEPEPEAGEEAEAEPESEPESDYSDCFEDNNIFISEIYISHIISNI